MIRIRNLCAALFVAEGREAREFATASFAYGIRQIACVVGEEQERLIRAKLFVHEQQRNLRREQQQARGGPQRIWWAQLAQALAERAVADLIVVLQKHHE